MLHKKCRALDVFKLQHFFFGFCAAEFKNFSFNFDNPLEDVCVSNSPPSPRHKTFSFNEGHEPQQNRYSTIIVIKKIAISFRIVKLTITNLKFHFQTATKIIWKIVAGQKISSKVAVQSSQAEVKGQ